MNQSILVHPATESDTIHFDWGRLTWFASRALGNSDDMTVGRCVLLPGMGNPRHYHPNCSEVLTVISGHIRHTIAGGGEQEMKPDDTVTIPANVWHCAKNIGSTEAVLFIVFSSADRVTVGE